MTTDMPEPDADEYDDNQPTNAEVFDQMMRECGAPDWYWEAIKGQELAPESESAIGSE